MTLMRALFVTACGPLVLTLTACQPASQSTDESESELLVSSAGKGGVPGFTPQGWGWKQGSRVEISLFNEPDSQGKANPNWKKILDETVDPLSMFGFSSNPPFYPVRRTLCGNPAPRQFMLVMAKNTDTGKLRIRPLPVDLYFTFQPCPHSGVAMPQAPLPAQ
jgi:hypothetical protein